MGIFSVFQMLVRNGLKTTFAFGYADLGKLDSQIEQAIATTSVHLIFHRLGQPGK